MCTGDRNDLNNGLGLTDFEIIFLKCRKVTKRCSFKSYQVTEVVLERYQLPIDT